VYVYVCMYVGKTSYLPHKPKDNILVIPPAIMSRCIKQDDYRDRLPF